MAYIYLVRHGMNDFVGKRLAGRMPHIHLNELGLHQAQQLAHGLRRDSIQQIFSSPLERAQETAQPLAHLLGLPIQITQSLTEIDFGDWTDLLLSNLSEDPSWRCYNSFRTGTRIPNGESVFEVQSRMVAQIESLRLLFPQQRIALFSHGDPIRAALAYYLGLSLDFLLRLEISPASVSLLQLTDYPPQIIYLNRTFNDFPAPPSQPPKT